MLNLQDTIVFTFTCIFVVLVFKQLCIKPTRRDSLHLHVFLLFLFLSSYVLNLQDVIVYIYMYFCCSCF